MRVSGTRPTLDMFNVTSQQTDGLWKFAKDERGVSEG